jgi:selenocysteine-specific elongation factor
VIVGTAGHIDHGKTSLVRALTGVDTDRLKEEKARGITIELGFAYWPRPGGNTIGFVDVPGHERFVHTMLAGATGIDFVMLVIAADDGVMPQTREHLAIIDLLGIPRGLVALTKSDLVPGDRLAEVTSEIEALLAGTGLAGAPVVPVSSVTGAGLADLTSLLDAAGATIRRAGADRRFRLAVDRVFSLAGAGTVVTGTVLSGRVGVGDQVLVSPSGLDARVRSIHAQSAAATSGMAGQRCALALVGPRIDTSSVARGDLVLDPSLHAPTLRIDGRLRLLASETRPMAQWTGVKFHHASREIGARVVLLRDGRLAPGEADFVQIVLDAPTAIAVGDRLVLRDAAASRTIGGGEVVDIRPPERRRKSPERRAELEALQSSNPEGALAGLFAAGRGIVDLDQFLADRALPSEFREALIRALDLETFATVDALMAMPRSTWLDYGKAMIGALAAFHKERSDQPGLGQERLRLSLRPRLAAAVFTPILGQLAGEGQIVVERAWVRLPGHEVRFSDEEERVWRRVLPLLGGSERFRPPRVRDVSKLHRMDEALLRRLFKLAARRGDVEEVAHDHFFLAATMIEMAGLAGALAAASPVGEFSVAAFRDRLDNGRKVAVQILEFFDRQGLTMRRGDVRRINPHKASLYGESPTPPASTV